MQLLTMPCSKFTKFRNRTNQRFGPKFVRAQVILATFLVAFVGYVNADTESPVPPTKAVATASLSLKQIMADPEWMGISPVNPRWSATSESIVYSRKAEGHTHSENYRYQLADGLTVKLPESESLWIAAQSANKNSDATQGVFEFQGDIYVINYQTSTIKGLTADEARQSKAQFVDDNSISYREGYQLFLLNLETNLGRQIASFETANDPDKQTKETYLEQSQPRLIKYLQQKEAEKAFQKKRNESIKLNVSKTWYLGKGVEIRTFQVSPDAKWVLLGTTKKSEGGKPDHMPEFVTSDGYVNDREVRPLVGTSVPTDESFYLVDLENQQKYAIDTSNLPGINDDPLESLKKSGAKKVGYKYQPLKGARAIYAHNWGANGGVEWSEDSRNMALILYSFDNKDRWIVGLDTESRKLKTLHWMTDDAWINDWTFNQFGWLPDNKTLFYLSEEDGYSHIYIKKGKRRARQLTEGQFEVSNVTVAKNGDYLYFKANKPHPGIYEIYRISVKGGEIEPLTDLGGLNDYVLSPDESNLLVRHSKMTQMPELFVVTLGENSSVTQITDTASDEFKSVNWTKPEIVEVPSSKVKSPIYSRYYASQTQAKMGSNQRKPAVIFVHGAGYLQNSHQGWSNYFREFMFHSLLTQQGYEVLDMDYRASKGYGSSWRTAIYRNMGTPELEDLVDGANWLVQNKNVDPKRIGIYGGSYGGFMTFMALFKEPEVFAAGAALRPVTDWAHYNHGYTSNILNTPQVDPEAFERSSPIEFAEGLNKPLLIAHGMVDDNVFFKDSVRLVQRLIELEKTPYFETAIYPVEPHGFKQPSSWLDEYTRIHQLFERHLN